MGAFRPPPSPFGDERQICCSMTSVLLRAVKEMCDAEGVEAVLRRSGSSHDADFLGNTDNWISLDEAMALLRAGIEVTEDPGLAERVGADAVRQHAGTQVATLLRSLGSPEAVLGGITATASKFSTVSRLEAIETHPGRCVVRAVGQPPLTRPALLCAWTKGLLSTPPMLFGLPPAEVEEVECQASGGRECRYVVSWDAHAAAATADPQQRVTELEAQLLAMAQRLESVYATSSDLVSPDDLGTVLARIVSRAANAVRAPAFVLAVRPDPDGELQVFSDGLSRREATRIGGRAVNGAIDASEMLCVRVASGRRDYGRLVAIQSDGMRFFPQERQLLALYAKHAAAVLDTATALADSVRRNRDFTALLSLAQTLAQAGTTREVATRLAEGVLGVVDCDLCAVWTWDEGREVFRREGVAAPVATAREELHPGETRYLERMLKDPQPMFFDEDVEDPLLVTIMSDARLVALAVVPIIAREVFLGMLAFGVQSKGRRLASSAALCEQLEGVAALAAPALQNGRLIDELDRQVVQDGLTGVLNRTGFGRSFDELLKAVSGGAHAGLLYIDLDSFKVLNDEHGHRSGDQMLAQVGERLRTAFRDDDVVARLGGDEFAVLLARVNSPHDLRQAAERARAVFLSPFALEGMKLTISASVGGALAPLHGRTIDQLLQHADAAMYRDKARACAVR
jgi:diguanylate cyclase (GGDEF)-like protein